MSMSSKGYNTHIDGVHEMRTREYILRISRGSMKCTDMGSGVNRYMTRVLTHDKLMGS